MMLTMVLDSAACDSYACECLAQGGSQCARTGSPRSSVVSLVLRLVACTITAALIVTFVVPPVISPLLGAVARQAGLDGSDVRVSVDFLGLGLFSGRVGSVRLEARDVTVPRGVVGRMDLTLEDVGVGDHEFSAVRGRLEDLQLRGPDGLALTVRQVDLEGPATRALARGHLDAEQLEQLVREMSADEGVVVGDIGLDEDRISMSVDGRVREGRLRVDGRALILDSEGRSTILIAPEPAEPWRPVKVQVHADGVDVDLQVDARRVVNAARARAPD
jgi:hypothetical protein